jgi:hypothetical protein
VKKLFLIFAGVLLGIILFQFLFYSCEKRKLNRGIDSLREQLDACLKAPAHSDTVKVSDALTKPINVPIHDYRVIGKKPLKPVSNTHYGGMGQDTTTGNYGVPLGSDFAFSIDSMEQREYTGTYIHPQFELHWTAKVTGTLDALTINPPSLIKSLIITNTKTVDLTKYQTPEPVKERGHIYTSLAVGTNFTAGNTIDANLMFVSRKGLGLITGVQSDFSQLYFRAGFIVKLK